MSGAQPSRAWLRRYSSRNSSGTYHCSTIPGVGNTACIEFSSLTGDDLVSAQNGCQSGTWGSGACTREGILGGCQLLPNQIDWYYAGGSIATAADVTNLCTRNGCESSWRRRSARPPRRRRPRDTAGITMNRSWTVLLMMAGGALSTPACGGGPSTTSNVDAAPCSVAQVWSDYAETWARGDDGRYWTWGQAGGGTMETGPSFQTAAPTPFMQTVLSDTSNLIVRSGINCFLSSTSVLSLHIRRPSNGDDEQRRRRGQHRRRSERERRQRDLED